MATLLPSYPKMYNNNNNNNNTTFNGNVIKT